MDQWISRAPSQMAPWSRSWGAAVPGAYGTLQPSRLCSDPRTAGRATFILLFHEHPRRQGCVWKPGAGESRAQRGKWSLKGKGVDGSCGEGAKLLCARHRGPRTSQLISLRPSTMPRAGVLPILEVRKLKFPKARHSIPLLC